MELFLIILGGVLLAVGIVGCILPGLPGPILSYAGLLALHFTDEYSFTPKRLVIWGVVVLAITILDYIIPIIGTKKFGGSKKGVWGSTIGLIAGIIFTPIGMILGAFLGAFIGELIEGKTANKSFIAACGAIIGLLTGTLLKLIVSIVFVYFYIQTLI